MVEVNISVIIPAFNAKNTIGNTLKSILKQDFDKSRFEVVVVDDGSSDGTSEHAKALLSDSGVQHRVVTQKNSGSWSTY